jgi:hypothetical protein
LGVIELITGPPLQNPRRVGRELRGELAGMWSARRGDFRVLSRIDDARRRSRPFGSIAAGTCVAPEPLADATSDPPAGSATPRDAAPFGQAS